VRISFEPARVAFTRDKCSQIRPVEKMERERERERKMKEREREREEGRKINPLKKAVGAAIIIVRTN